MNILENFIQSPSYSQFLNYLKKRYPEEYESFTPKDIQMKFEVIFTLGLNQAEKYRNINKLDHLLFNDKPPRADMVQKLGHILFELQQIPSFPIVPPLRVSAAIKKVLSSRDKRTRDKYLKWIIELSNSNPQFNTFDLTHIVRQFPEEKIVPGGLW